jgi:lysophospholipase L1-like esterase
LPAPFSRDCQAVHAGDPSTSPVPNVAKALRERKTLRILAIGAASSSGRHGQHNGGYTAQIEQILEQAMKGLNVVIINRGVSGELAADAERRIKIEVALNDPDLVLWQVGTNDALSYIPIDDLRNTLTETIQWLKEHNVDVVLAGLQFVNRMTQDEHYREVRNLIRSVAAKENVMVVRRPEAMKLLSNAASSGGGLFPEEFAQTEAGYSCLAEYVSRAITLGAFGKGLKDQPPRPPAPAQ